MMLRETAAVGVLAVMAAVNTPLVALILSLFSVGLSLLANWKVNKALEPLGRWVETQAEEVAEVGLPPEGLPPQDE